jgi:hypothetical protein
MKDVYKLRDVDKMEVTTMAEWKCDCGCSRELRSDGVVETCSNCGIAEHDALREAVEPEEYQLINQIEEME